MARRLSEGDVHAARARKHSSGDLHSRLKTRKLLGVGETDDGDVHRSKLSQILGHSEQLYVRLPKGLRAWQVTTAFMFTFVGLWALIFPRHLFSFALASDLENSIVLPIRLYGTALISLSLVFWHTTQSMDKDVIRWSLLGSATYFTLQFIVCLWSAPHHLVSLSGMLLVLVPLGVIVPPTLYLRANVRHHKHGPHQ